MKTSATKRYVRPGHHFFDQLRKRHLNQIIGLCCLFILLVVSCQFIRNEKNGIDVGLTKAIDLFYDENRNEELLGLLSTLPDSRLTLFEIQLRKIVMAAGLCESGRVDSAYALINRVDKASLSGNPCLQFWQRSIMGLILFRKNELAQAYTLLNQPASYAYNESAIGLNMRIMGRIALAMNDYRQCLDWMMQSSRHFASAGRAKSVAINEKMIGRCYMLIENYHEAIAHFKKAEAELLIYTDELELFYVYINILDYDLKLGHINEARQYAALALAIAEKFTDDNLSVLISNNLGEIALSENRYDEAIRNFHQALAYCQKVKAPRSEVVANIGLSKAFDRLGRSAEAGGYAQNALMLAKATGQNPLCLMASQNLANFFTSSDKIEAFTYLDLANRYRDSAKIASADVYQAFCKVKTELDESIANLERLKQKQKNGFLMFLGIVGLFTLTAYYGFKLYYSNYYKFPLRTGLANSEVELPGPAKNQVKPCLANGLKISDEKIALLTQELARVMEKEKAYCNPELSLNLLAEKINTNREYLSQVINNVIGKNFIDYINEYRIEDAKLILAEQITQKTRILNIAAIANSVGFKNTSTFNPVFKKATGYTPSDYKKALENASGLTNSENIIL
jgi:AraC-like DNA-binding protein